MTPEEKAKQLVAHYKHYAGDAQFGTCKQCQAVGMRHCAHADTCGNVIINTVDKACAALCCDEIIAEIEPDLLFQNYNERVTYWKDIKEEIQKL